MRENVSLLFTHRFSEEKAFLHWNSFSGSTMILKNLILCQPSHKHSISHLELECVFTNIKRCLSTHGNMRHMRKNKSFSSKSRHVNVLRKSVFATIKKKQRNRNDNELCEWETGEYVKFKRFQHFRNGSEKLFDS